MKSNFLWNWNCIVSIWIMVKHLIDYCYSITAYYKKTCNISTLFQYSYLLRSLNCCIQFSSEMIRFTWPLTQYGFKYMTISLQTFTFPYSHCIPHPQVILCISESKCLPNHPELWWNRTFLLEDFHPVELRWGVSEFKLP